MDRLRPIVAEGRENIPSSAMVVEAFEPSLRELFFIRNPEYKKETAQSDEPLKDFLINHKVNDVWVYYPFQNVAVHTVPEDVYFELRTSRNKNIITREEQFAFRNAKVGVAGLSVGSAVLGALVASGGPKVMKIADFDALEVSNLNRLKATLLDVGMNKAEIAAREAWALDPFAELDVWKDGISSDTLSRFLLESPRLDIFIDEMDNIDLKVKARDVARANRIPVIMATDNGDGVILDVERFDEEPDREIFHGLLGDIKSEELADIDFREWVKIATKIVGPEYLSERMQESISELGKTIASIPQLGASAQIAGSAVSYAVRRIANGQKMPSGRYCINLEEIFMSRGENLS